MILPTTITNSNSYHRKELTDEEIKEVIRKHWNREYKNKSMLEFARAILRKAWD